MNNRTLSAIAVLEKADWFCQVGINQADTVQTLSSWQEAMKYCDSVDGENFGLAGMNEVRDQVRVRADSRYQQWNDIVHDLEPAVKPLVKRKIDKVFRENDLPREPFELMVYKGILRPCIELEYCDVLQPGFFANIAYWYVKGHFPCGWKGVYTKEKYSDGVRRKTIEFYPAGFYDKIAHWYEKGDFGDWQGQIPPPGKLIVY